MQRFFGLKLKSYNIFSFGIRLSINQNPLGMSQKFSFSLNFQEFLASIKNCDICDAVPCIASLVKLCTSQITFGRVPPKISSKLLLLVLRETLTVLPGSCNFIRPLIWHKTWGVNQRTSKDVAQKCHERGPQQRFLFDIVYTALKIDIYVISCTEMYRRQKFIKP